MLSELMLIITEQALAYLFIILFIVAGKYFLKRTGLYLPGLESSYGHAFYSLLFGALFIVCSYSLFVAKGITINMLMIPLFLLLVKKKERGMRVIKVAIPYLEIFVMVFIGVIILHLLPESEYKQNDSFYYLKIAESLNRTGQENTYHYYNVYNDLFHGTEPYHYFELWCTAFITKLTGFFYTNILIHRFVVYSIFITAIVLGLYTIVFLLRKENIRWWHKPFCWSLVFFMPDLLMYFPDLSKLFISNLEGNFLERPNFRILYALLIPVVAENISGKPRVPFICFWLLIIAIVSFKFTLLVIPALLLAGMYLSIIKKHRSAFQYIWYALGFAGCFGLFYFFTGISQMPTLYTTSLADVIDETRSHWKFILYSIVASIGYLLVVAAIFLVPFFKLKKDALQMFSFFRSNFLLVMIALLGVLAARILFIKDNAYQFLFAAHIIVFLLIWVVGVIAVKKAQPAIWLFAAFLFSVPVIIKLAVFKNAPDIFIQNGNHIYNGKKYSPTYLDSVATYFQDHPEAKGAYMADSNFYRQTYYSRRNPTVYFLPLTYIISKKVNHNIELCISDSACIITGTENPVHIDYLRSAVQRSLFYQYQKKHPLSDIKQVQKKFLKEYRISYLIATADVSLDFIGEDISIIYKDAITGEQFIILKP